MVSGPSPLMIAACVVGGYLLGSAPFGVLITRAAGLGDVRAIGSGNIGATNVLRTGRRDLALATLLLDGGKGAAALLIARALFGDPAVEAAGAAAFLGHLFPIWLRFKGGKGVATFFGVMIAAAWPAGLLAGAVWIGMAAAFRYSSLAALTAAALGPALALVTGQSRDVIWLALFMAVLVFIRHGSNIARLRAGAEPRIGAEKAKAREILDARP